MMDVFEQDRQFMQLALKEAEKAGALVKFRLEQLSFIAVRSLRLLLIYVKQHKMQ